MNKKQRNFYRGKKVLVYGATGGLGEALCRELRDQAAGLVLAGRNADKLENLSENLQAPGAGPRAGLEAWTVAGEDMTAFAERIRQAAVDGMIVATGKTCYQDFIGGDIAETWRAYQELLHVNLLNVMRLALDLLPYFRQRGGFLHVAGSYACIFPLPYQAMYSASKAALLSFVQAVAQEQRADCGFAATRGLLSISLIGGMATNMYYQSGLHKQFSGLEALLIAPPERISRGILHGIAKRKEIITVGLCGSLVYHLVRRLPANWMAHVLFRAYRPGKKL